MTHTDTKIYNTTAHFPHNTLTYAFVWPCNVTDFFIIKPTRCTNFTNLFCRETLRVSESSSVHHQEFIHCTLSNGICHTGLYTAFEQGHDPQSAHVQHILHNRHEYGPTDKTMTLLKPLSNTSLLTLYEQYYKQSLHKEGKLISEQSPGDPNPLLLLAMDPSRPVTWPYQSVSNLNTAHKTTRWLLRTTTTTPSK
jgi:hypothetical protein